MDKDFHFSAWMIGGFVLMPIGILVMMAYWFYHYPVEAGLFMLTVLGLLVLPYLTGRVVIRYLLESDNGGVSP